jgi:hypothetical protein
VFGFLDREDDPHPLDDHRAHSRRRFEILISKFKWRSGGTRCVSTLRVIPWLPPGKRDGVLPIIDRWERIMRSING